MSNVGKDSTGKILQGAGTSSSPKYSTATYPSTTTINQILYSSSNNVVGEITAANQSVLTSSTTGVPSWTSVATNGQLIIGSTAGNPAAATLTAGAGISVTNGSNSITIAVNGSTVGQTITGDSGGALSPTAGNWNILGGPGVTTSGSGSTLTINSIVFTDTTATTLVSDNGYFATAAGTYTLPASPLQGETIIIVADTSGAVVVDAPSTHLIRIGNQITSAGGTLTSTAIGDSLTLRYRSSSTTWFAVSAIGNWTVA
jgi:hypothetical protein